MLMIEYVFDNTVRAMTIKIAPAPNGSIGGGISPLLIPFINRIDPAVIDPMQSPISAWRRMWWVPLSPNRTVTLPMSTKENDSWNKIGAE